MGLTKSIVLWRGNAIDKSKVSGYPPAKCMNFAAKPNNASVNLTWEDPDDISIDGGTSTVRWAKTVIVRKTGSYPTNEGDGTVVVTSTIKNWYKSTPYTDTGLTNGTTYYYAAFACSSDGSYNEEVVTATAIPVAYKTMTVQFTITETPGYGIYLDDATGMAYGKTSEAVTKWQKFFGYKPCLFKNGAVVGYLNPNNYEQFEDGTFADISSGDAGDVMVEFPRRGIKISKSGNTVTVSMTDADNAEGYSYNAHNRGNTQKDYFYIGAYLGYLTGSLRIRSLSGKQPTTRISLNELRTYTGNLGPGYMEVGFYQYLFIQCMYLLQYKGHLNSQSVHGYGYCDGRSVVETGLSNAKGVMYGTTSGSSSSDHIKLFGIEDFWGNVLWKLDGYYVNNYGNILTATDGFNNTGANYNDNGQCGVTASSTFGYIYDVVGTSEVGFTPLTINSSGSKTKYFCAGGCVSSSGCPKVGGAYMNGVFTWNGFGIFYFYCDGDASASSGDTAGRLAYL